jgi:mycofactocin precursor
VITLFVTTGQRAPHSGAINGPSGWVGNCPVGEFNCYARYHTFVTGITPGPMSWRYPMSDPNENQTGSAAEQLVEETLVEEISIDGMCGVY